MNKKIIIFELIIGLVLTGCNYYSHGKDNDNKHITVKQVSKKNKVADNQNKNTTARIYAKPEIPILCYHRIEYGRKSYYSVTPATFTAHMKVLADSGYHSVSPNQLYDYLVYNKSLPTKPVMITFDDSREAHFNIAAPVMEKYGFRGVFFIMTVTYNKKNYMTKEQIAQLAKAGHTIGLHSWDHVMVTKYKEADWIKQVINPKKELEKIIGAPVEYWAYPNGVYDHKGAVELSKYFKLSFTLISKRDSVQPLQTIRRMIVPECSPQGLLKSMHRTFSKQ